MYRPRYRTVAQESLKEWRLSSVSSLKSFPLSNGKSSRVVWISAGNPEVCSHEFLLNMTPDAKPRVTVSAASTTA